MKNKFTLTIPNPCAADWQHMSVAEKGRFCQACQTTVTDFSTMDDASIKNYFRNNSGKVCGRFQAQQLKEYVLPSKPRLFFTFLSVCSLTSMLTSLPGLSQSPPATVQTPISPEQTLPNLQVSPVDSVVNTFIIKGRILEENNKNQSIPGATISVKGATTGTVSKADGSFQLQIPDTPAEKVTLVISFISYKTVEKEISYAQSTEVDLGIIYLPVDALMLGEVVTVGQVVPKWYQPRSFWWRFKQLF